MKTFTASSLLALASAERHQARVQVSVDDLGMPRFYTEGTDRVTDDSQVEVLESFQFC